MRWTLVLLSVLATAAPSFGQNMVLNPGFEDPAVATSCEDDRQVVTSWTGLASRNVKFYNATCPRVAGDTAHASKTGWGTETQSFSQTVAVTPGTTYTLSGYWAMGHMDNFGLNTVTAEMHDGASPGTLIAKAQVLRGPGANDWLPFSVNGTPTQAQMTIVMKTSNSGATGYALHVNDVQLILATCLQPPTVDAIGKTYGARGATLDNAQITGSNFTAGKTSVKLSKAGQADIVATDVQVLNSSTLTCDIAVPANAALGGWDVAMAVSNNPPNQLNCDPAVVPAAFLVILPAFSNGSFELPTAAGGCPAAPIAGIPTDWSVDEIAEYGYGNVLFRDSDRFPPTCPPKDGLHYGSSISDNNGGAGAQASLYQTFSVTPSTPYTFSGYFAGGGNNKVRIRLLDGTLATGVLLGETVVHDPGGSYNWVFYSVPGTPTGDIMTALWFIDLEGVGPHAAHADALAVDVCTTPFTLGSITPNSGLNDAPVSITDLSGNGFTGTPTVPTVQLTGPGGSIVATNVVVVSSSKITCEFDLTKLTASGRHDVVVKQGGCAQALTDAFLVIAANFVNGSFEEPDVGAVNCGPPPQTVGGLPTGWNTNAPSGVSRDGAAPVPPACPSPTDGGHYASMSEAGGGTVRAWQVLAVKPGWTYKFDGEFTAPDGVGIFLRLLNGDETGTELASAQVTGGAAAWAPGSVEATAASSVMTVVWEMQISGTEPAVGGHADGLKFEATVPCSVPRADANGDGDVDQYDFAEFQLCVTGGSPANPPQGSCLCVDFNGDLDVDQGDFLYFEGCATGSAMAWSASPECPE